MEVTIHAGLHKTGTKNFQQLLRRNAPHFARAGIRALLVPPQVSARDPRKFDPAWIARQLALARDDGIELVIVSHENISILTEDQMRRLAEPFAGYRAKVVLCFRHWITALPSRWQQNTRRCDSQSFTRFLRSIMASEEPRVDLDNDLAVAAARAAGFDDIVAVSYDGAGARLLAVVAEACGIAPALLEGLPGLDAVEDWRHQLTPVLEITRLLNGVLAEALKAPQDQLHRTFGNGTQALLYFDLAPAIERLRAERPALVAELSGALAARKRSHLLRPEDFAAQAAGLERAVAGRIWNPTQGKLIPPLGPRAFEASDLEYSELPPALSGAMLDALRAIGFAL